MATAWTSDRFASIDWRTLSGLPATATHDESAKLVQSWFDGESDPDKKEALAVLRDLLSMRLLWEPTRREIIGDQILVEVKLTTAGLIKTGIGGTAITRGEDNKTVLSLADDIKMAEADALKRACRLLGIGGELYASEQDDDGGLISGPPPANGNGNGNGHDQRQDGPFSRPPSPLPPRERLTSAQLNAIKDRVKKQGLDPAAVRKQVKTTYGIELEYLNKKQASEVITGLDNNRPSNGNDSHHASAG